MLIIAKHIPSGKIQIMSLDDVNGFNGHITTTPTGYTEQHRLTTILGELL